MDPRIDPRLGIVGGNGWIGGALARALVAAGLPPEQLTLSCRSTPPAELTAVNSQGPQSLSPDWRGNGKLKGI